MFVIQEDLSKIVTFCEPDLSLDHDIEENNESLVMESFKQEFRKDTTPKWVSNSKDTYLTYQIAKNCIEKDIFNSFCMDGFRFVHLRFVEILAAQFFLNQVEDSLHHITSGFLMESSAFQKSFNNCFPHNFLFSRRYREVL